MENDVAWYSHWPRSWGTGGRSCCEGGAGHGLGVDPVGRESCWVCWLQATIHKIETSYPASSPARWGKQMDIILSYFIMTSPTQHVNASRDSVLRKWSWATAQRGAVPLSQLGFIGQGGWVSQDGRHDQTWMLRQGLWSPCTRRCELRPAPSLWQMPQQLQLFVLLRDNQEEEQWEENLSSSKNLATHLVIQTASHRHYPGMVEAQLQRAL